MKEFLTNLQMKYKIAILVGMLIIITIIFVIAYNYYYSDSEYISSENIMSEANIDENNLEQSDSLLDDENNNSNKTNNKLGISRTEKTIMVHVIGEVESPGVVILEEGARIIDAIESAGGKTEDADLSKINLAYVIEDGVQIYVPRIGEKSNETNIREEAGEGVIIENSEQDEIDNKIIKVNINTANLEKLQTLPGIGSSTAQKILEYRKENGNFKIIEDIKNVSGIGDSKYNSLKDYIVVK